jgi:hypothetical protein
MRSAATPLPIAVCGVAVKEDDAIKAFMQMNIDLARGGEEGASKGALVL